MELKLLTDLGPKTKIFSWQWNHHIGKALQRSYISSLTLSRLFPLKTLLLKESINYYDHFKKCPTITMTIIHIWMKKSKLATTFIFKLVGESNRKSPDLIYSSIVFFIWWHSSYSIQTSMEDLCHQKFVNIVQINI